MPSDQTLTESLLLRCARAAVAHWQECGPRYGFAAVMADLEHAVHQALMAHVTAPGAQRLADEQAQP